MIDRELPPGSASHGQDQGVLLESAACYTKDELRTEDDWIAVEEPLEIRVAGEAMAVTMRTPGDDHELAVGFLMSEGIVSHPRDLGAVAHCGRLGDEGYGNVIDVLPGPGTSLTTEAASLRRGTLTSASCGICGRRSVADLVERVGEIHDPVRITPESVIELTERLRLEQQAFARTGGIHAAGLATTDGRYLHVREDIGRHNAVDKLLGRLLMDGELPARGRVLVISGRSSFEIVQKAACAGIPIVIGVSAASSLAIRTARAARITLVGFSRNGGFNVYAGAERIMAPEARD